MILTCVPSMMDCKVGGTRVSRQESSSVRKPGHGSHTVTSCWVFCTTWIHNPCSIPRVYINRVDTSQTPSFGSCQFCAAFVSGHILLSRMFCSQYYQHPQVSEYHTLLLQKYKSICLRYYKQIVIDYSVLSMQMPSQSVRL